MGKVIEYNETRVRMIAGDLRASITQDDKLYILALAQSLGVEKSGCKTCPNYFRDLALLIYTNMAKKKTQPKAGENWELKEGVDVIFGDVRVNAATIDNAKAEWLDKHGFPRKFWEVIPNSNAD